MEVLEQGVLEWDGLNHEVRQVAPGTTLETAEKVKHFHPLSKSLGFTPSSHWPKLTTTISSRI